MVLPAPFGPSRATRSPRATVEVDAVQRHVAVRVAEAQAARRRSEGRSRRSTVPIAMTAAATGTQSPRPAHCAAVAAAGPVRAPGSRPV